MQAKYDQIIKELGTLGGVVGVQLEAMDGRLDKIQDDISEIKGDIKELHKCYVDVDKRATLLEKNGASLHTLLDESKADRKSLREVVQKMEMNWTKLLTVGGMVGITMSILSPQLGQLGEGIMKLLGSK